MAAASVMPSYWLFALALVAAGLALQSIMVTANSLVQLGTEPAMRGRVMALYMTIFAGGTPIGAPLMGWIANTYGPRVAVAAGAGAACWPRSSDSRSTCAPMTCACAGHGPCRCDSPSRAEIGSRRRAASWRSMR